MFDSILFDLDGTLWDTTDIVAEAWNTILENENGIDVRVTGAQLRGLFGRPLPEIASIIFPELSKEEQVSLIGRCCEEEHRALEKTPGILYPELEETLDALSKKYPLCIVSNCEAGYIELFLRVTGLTKYFTDHICPGDTGMGKGDNNLALVKRNGFQAPVYVGDTLGDANAAAYAKIPFIFAGYGFGQVTEYYAKINAFSELKSLLL